MKNASLLAVVLSSSALGAASVLTFSGITLFTDQDLYPIDSTQPLTWQRTLAVADFDKDGYDDLVNVYSRFGDETVCVLLNQSGTGFVEVWTMPSITFNARGVHVGDFNGDGWIDLMSDLNLDNGGAKVWINQIPNNPVCASDLDKTGNVDFSDLLFVLNEWGECGQQIN